MDICHLKNDELEPKVQKYKGRVVLRGDTVKDGLWGPVQSLLNKARVRQKRRQQVPPECEERSSARVE